LASPLVQVTVQPVFVISHWHMHIIMLQQQTIMPFIIAQQLTMPPASMLQRFCIMLHAVGSSQVHIIFMPPAHFSNFIVQRGTIIMVGIIGAVPLAGAMPAPMPGIPIPVRSIIIALVIAGTPFTTGTSIQDHVLTNETSPPDWRQYSGPSGPSTPDIPAQLNAVGHPFPAKSLAAPCLNITMTIIMM
jgi:hypothetical protein